MSTPFLSNNNKRRSSKTTRSSTFIDKLADQTSETINYYDFNVPNPLEIELSNYANLNVTVCAQDQDIAKACIIFYLNL